MRVQGPFKKSGCLRVARNAVLRQLNGLWDRAEKEGWFFRCKWTGTKFTPKQLIKEMKKGLWIRGPQCWHLIDAQGRRVA